MYLYIVIHFMRNLREQAGSLSWLGGLDISIVDCLQSMDFRLPISFKFSLASVAFRVNHMKLYWISNFHKFYQYYIFSCCGLLWNNSSVELTDKTSVTIYQWKNTVICLWFIFCIGSFLKFMIELVSLYW